MRGLSYLLYSAVSSSLLSVMVLLPLAPVFADEIEADVSSDGATVEVREGEDVVANDVAHESSEIEEPDTQENVSDVLNSENAETVVEEEFLSTAETDETMTQEASETVAPDTESTGVDDLGGSTENADSDDTDLPEEGDTGVSDDVMDDATPVDEEVGEVLEEETDDTPNTPNTEVTTSEDGENTSTTTDENSEGESVDENVVAVNTLTNETNKFSFAENECTTVGDGTFYCTKTEATPEVIHTDRIFSAVDAEGDKEIYVEKDGEVGAITDNHYDDDAPYYDEGSDSAVWHRLVDGRYQIISYDFSEEEETQLTHDRYNNMQPSRYGDATVWQGWVGDDWEVFMLVNDELTMLTDNTTHDINPSINGTHVVWQSFENNVWMMKVYDLRTEETRTIEDTGGGSIENPRFVLVYDSKQDTGDIATRGYDLKSGEVIDLASEPVSVPDEIPDPDQTGEERALVTTITQLKPKTEDEADGDIPNNLTTGNGDDVVIPPLDSTTTTPTSTPTVADEPNDLVVEPVATATSTDASVTHIEDVVITPYAPQIASTTDSQ